MENVLGKFEVQLIILLVLLLVFPRIYISITNININGANPGSENSGYNTSKYSKRAAEQEHMIVGRRRRSLLR